jgi:hypothetical protein
MWADLTTARDRVLGNISTLISDIYSFYSAGDIPTDALLDAGDVYSVMSTDYESTGYFGYAAASAAALGIPSTSDYPMQVYLVEQDATVKAHLYSSTGPDGTSGSTWDTGTTYDPSTLPNPVYMAYEHTQTDADGNTQMVSDFVQLTGSFRIESAKDKDGNDVSSVSVESKNQQTYDVAQLEAELEELRKEYERQQDEAQTAAGGGSFDWNSLSIGGLPGEAVALIVAGIGALIWSSQNN